MSSTVVGWYTLSCCVALLDCVWLCSKTCGEMVAVPAGISGWALRSCPSMSRVEEEEHYTLCRHRSSDRRRARPSSRPCWAGASRVER